MLLGLSGALMMLQSESGAGLACIFLRATLRSSGRRLPEPMWVRSAYTCSMQSVVGSARSSALPHCLGHSPSRLLKKCTGNGAKRACIMAAGKCVEFSKYQGLGNDFILVCPCVSAHVKPPQLKMTPCFCNCRWITGSMLNLL